MKIIKKLFVVALTFMLSFCMINIVSAEDATTGSITVSGTTEGKTYEVYKIFDLTYSGTNVAYTIDSDWINFFATEEGSKYIVANDSTGKLNQITIESETKYINITDDNVSEFTQAALDFLAKNSIDADETEVAEDTTIVFEGLDLGYYLVYPQGATDIKEGYSSIASITSTLPNAEVVIKATYPTIEKEVNTHTFNVGEYAEFTITGVVPDTTGYTSYTYQINDTWTAGLELDTTNVAFTIIIGGTTITDVTPVYNSTNTGFTLTFDMTNYQEQVGETITVTYKLKVTEDAINSTTTQNSATLTYNNNPKDLTQTTTTPPVVEKVYSSKIIVTKVAGENHTIKLAGAKFVLANEEGEYYQAVLDDNNNLIEVKWVELIEDATELTTTEDGIITFEGLKDGNYNLLETKAPEGYNKLTGPVAVTVAGSTDTDSNPIPVVTETTVENNTGIALPSTGGIGTTLFIVIGSLLTIASAIILITNKRMSKEF